MHTLTELVANMGHASVQGVFGVTAIYLYLALIVGTAFVRIRQFARQPRHDDAHTHES